MPAQSNQSLLLNMRTRQALLKQCPFSTQHHIPLSFFLLLVPISEPSGGYPAALRGSGSRPGTARARPGTARPSTARHGTVRHGTAQSGTARHGTARAPAGAGRAAGSAASPGPAKASPAGWRSGTRTAGAGSSAHPSGLCGGWVAGKQPLGRARKNKPVLREPQSSLPFASVGSCARLRSC